MRIPSTVKIAGRVIQVIVEDHLEDWGHYDHDDGIIKLSRRAADGPEALPTLRHEMVHAALHIGGVAYSESMEEEAVIRCLDGVFWPAWDNVTMEINQECRKNTAK